MTASEVKNIHKADRSLESKARMMVRQNLREEGATSNLYPILAAPGAVVHRYELVVTRKTGAQGAAGRLAGTISSSKGWRSFSNGLRRFQNIPPMVRVDNKVYAPSPLSEEMLELPSEYCDLGWESCKLRVVDKVALADMPAPDYRSLVNKLFPWAIGLHAQRDGSFSTAREQDGKIVCTHDGLTVGGLRIYRGTIANAIFVDDTNNGSEALGTAAQKKKRPPPSSRLIEQLLKGDFPQAVPLPVPLVVRCVRHDRSVKYKDFTIQLFTLEDASGTITLTAWSAPVELLTPGKCYSLSNVRLRVNAKGTVVEYTKGTGHVTDYVDPAEAAAAAEDAAVQAATKSADSDATAPTAAQLALKLDTKCLVASEQSLWAEIQKNFGSGPFSEEVQRKITRIVQGTPVVVSTTLRHATVRVVRFNVPLDSAAVDSSIRQHLEHVDRNQPFAVLGDYTVVPLQALHCCFDPRMRTWQDVTVATCSFIPRKRVEVLSGFRNALSSGLSQWGLQVASEPFVSRSLAILNAPMKENKYQQQQQPPYQPQAAVSAMASIRRGPAMPSTCMFVSIANDRVGAEERDKCISTAQTLAKEFRSGNHAHANAEVDAIAAIDAALLVNGQLRDPHSAVVIVAPDRETRAMRWLVSECLRRGILPVCVPGVATRRQSLLAANVRVSIRTKYEQNPLKGINVHTEVPAIATKRVLFVGIDCCNTNSTTIGAAIGVLVAPEGNQIISTFWKNQVRGQEIEQVAEQFGSLVHKAMQQHRLDEIVVFQDGNVFSELQTMRKRVPVGCGLTFLCLHKRTNIRFLFKDKNNSTIANASKGVIIQSHTPAPLHYKPLAPSFYMQSHECPMSTARIVEYTVHAVSESLDISEVQRLSHAMSHVFAPLATKLPLPTRCAHRLSSIVEKLLDAAPDLQAADIPETLAHRMWYL